MSSNAEGNGQDVHGGQPVYHAGAPLESAQGVTILLHGRGASAQDILSLTPQIAHPTMAFLAPEAANSTWYPYSFLSPRAQNEPYLSSALGVVARLVAEMAARGFEADKIAIGGFSQGACLASEFVARNPQRYGGLIAFSGGLIGAQDEPLEYAGDLAQTPAFIGCSDIDPHIPLQRVEETAQILEELGAKVTKRIYPGMAHTVNAEELDLARALLADMVTA
ncbi:MAG: dienelactone hydrolase family protein [Litorilinea sp.]